MNFVTQLCMGLISLVILLIVTVPGRASNDNIFIPNEFFIDGIQKGMAPLGVGKNQIPERERLRRLFALSKLDLRYGRLEPGVTSLTQILETVPEFYPARALRAWAYVFLKKYDLATADIDEIQITNEPYAQQMAGLLRGLVLHGRNRNQEAIAELTEIVESAPELAATARFFRASAHLANGDTDEAMAEVDVILESEPRAHEALFLRGAIHASTGQHRTAVEDFSKAIELNKLNPHFYYRRAQSYRKLWALELAHRDLSIVLFLKGKNADENDYAARAETLEMLGNIPDAISDLSRAIEVQPKAPGLYDTRAELYQELGEFQKAENDFDESIKLDATDDWVFFTRALVRHRLGKLQDAVEDLDRSEEIDPDFLYNSIVRYLVAWEVNPESAKETLALKFAKRAETWQSSIASHLLGETDETTLLSLAVTLSQLPKQEALCEAYFYAGYVLMSNGKSEEAIARFVQVLETNQEEYIEYGLAEFYVEKLGYADRHLP